MFSVQNIFVDFYLGLCYNDKKTYQWDFSGRYQKPT